MKTSLPLLLLGGLLVMSAPAISQGFPPNTQQAKKIEALVTKAAALIESKGKAAAFAEFRKQNTEWLYGDTYLYAYDSKGNVLLNAAFPKREGTNIAGGKDAKGKPFQDEILKVAATQGSGWVSYMFPKPGQTEPSQKWAYVKNVTLDGVPGLIAAGFYPE
jgi:methyl-accepting chemotaxis protein